MTSLRPDTNSSDSDRLKADPAIDRTGLDRRAADTISRLKESMPPPTVGVTAYDPRGRCRYANEEAGAILGLKPGALLGTRLRESPFLLATGLLADAERALKESIPFRGIAQFTAPDGTPLLLDCGFEITPVFHQRALVVWFVDVTAFMSMDRALRESRERYRQLVDETPDFVFSLDLSGRFSAANRSLAAAVDRPVQKLIGKRLSEIGLPPELADQWHELFTTVVSTGTAADLESSAVMPDGRLRVLALAMRPLLTEEAQVFGVRTSARDITEQWQAKQAAQSSEHQLRTLTEKAPVAMLLARGEEAIYANPLFLDMFGLATPSLAAQYPLLDLAPPEIRGEIESRGIELWRHGGAEVALDLTLRRPSGFEFPAHVHFSKVELADGPAIMAFITDLTERRRAEESRLLTQFSVDQATDLVMWLDDSGQVIDASESACRRLGYSHTEVLQKTIFDIDPNASRKTWPRKWEEVREKGRLTFETWHLARSGEKIPVEVTTNYLVFAGRECLCSFSRDISERRQVEGELKRSAERMTKVVDSVVGALGSLSEYRDPYTAGHQQQVAQLACAIATHMGLDSQDLEGLRIASLLHDIGKVAVPIEILCKPGSITPHEISIIRVHPEVGYEILKDIDFPWPVADIVRQHHEYLDGSGYPAGLTGEQIRFEARILAVADVVEAMSSHRPYRPALKRTEMWRVLNREASQFDQNVIRACRVVLQKGLVILGSREKSLSPPGHDRSS